MGVPPLPAHPSALTVVVAMLAIGGVIFPLVGASLVAMVLIDWLATRNTATTRIEPIKMHSFRDGLGNINRGTDA
jgi:uncharacterized iron-regulated membrane protein